MKVLVTGCAGFVGHRVANLLLHQGHTVVGLDGLQGPYPAELYLQRLQPLRDNKDFQLVDGDIRRVEDVDDVIRSSQPDAILHLAARPGVRMSVDDPWTYLDTNVRGTLNVLESCRRHDVDRMVLASTSSLYGRDAQTPFNEDMSTDLPMSPYAASKKAAEAYASAYHHLYGTHTPRLRYFTVYGPAGRPDMAVHKFIDAIYHGKPITVYGDGSQQRDFTYVDDVANATTTALRVSGDPAINIGNDRPKSVTDLIQLIEQSIGKRALLQYEEAHSGDMPNTWAEISRAKELLSWSPTTSLATGIQRTVDWYTNSMTDTTMKLNLQE